MMKEEIINLPDSIFLGENVFKEIANVISKRKISSVFIIVDPNTRKFCLPVLLEENSFLSNAIIIEIPEGEIEKNLATCEKIISKLLDHNADRKSMIINLGGGVICDIGGFVAAIYKRGIDFINIPTTLLAMVDASVGGKNGVNFSNKKNMIGTFTHPAAVLIFPKLINTLLPKEKRSGLAEVIKHILLSEGIEWKGLLNKIAGQLNDEDLAYLIGHSVRFKSEIIKEDFLETGRRKILNFGHTIGHAVESWSMNEKIPLKHGEAIAAGITAELFLSVRLAGFPTEDMPTIVRTIRKIFYDINLNYSPYELFPFLLSDKKNSGDRIAFSLLSAPGIPEGIFYPEKDLILESLEFMIEEFSTASIQ